jgi:hypothetical protein
LGNRLLQDWRGCIARYRKRFQGEGSRPSLTGLRPDEAYLAASFENRSFDGGKVASAELVSDRFEDVVPRDEGGGHLPFIEMAFVVDLPFPARYQSLQSAGTNACPREGSMKYDNRNNANASSPAIGLSAFAASADVFTSMCCA